MLTASTQSAALVRTSLLERNSLYERFFSAEASRIAAVSKEMADRFAAGGRLLAFGRGPYATDAQHIAVEFVHPVIVGKRALPALDLSATFESRVDALLSSEDIVFGFGPPEGDPGIGDCEMDRVLIRARDRGAMTVALPGWAAEYCFRPPTTQPFLHQEMIEMLYHLVWETVHVFLERRELGHDAGASSFLYPFLQSQTQGSEESLFEQVASSIRTKVTEDAALRVQVADESAEEIARTAAAINDRLQQGGKLILFGNGGSATDANDLELDCVAPPAGYHPVPALSLSQEPATLTALANDVGVEVVFLRQLIAHAQPSDVAVAISTSGGSRNVIAALEYARKHKLLTVGLLGYDGGEIVRRGLVDHALVVRSDFIPRIQEVQATIYHTIRELLEALHAEA